MLNLEKKIIKVEGEKTNPFEQTNKQQTSKIVSFSFV